MRNRKMACESDKYYIDKTNLGQLIILQSIKQIYQKVCVTIHTLPILKR